MSPIAKRSHQNTRGGSHRARWPEVPLGCGRGEGQRRGGCKRGNSIQLCCHTHKPTANDYPEVGSTPARRSAEDRAMTQWPSKADASACVSGPPGHSLHRPQRVPSRWGHFFGRGASRPGLPHGPCSTTPPERNMIARRHRFMYWGPQD